MFSRRRRDLFAGLAIHTDSLRYVELEREAGELREVRREIVSLLPGCIIRESIARFDLLEKAFRTLRKRLGRFICPVVLGIPSGSVALKLIDYPPMPMEEAREALELEFKEYFPWPRDEAVLDVALIDAPLKGSGTAVLAAAANLSCTDGLLWIARHAGIPVAALEPVNTAFFRTVTGEYAQGKNYLVLALEPEVHSLILGHHGNGILFRSIPNDLNAGTGFEPESAMQALAEDIRATLAFAGNCFRGIEVHHLLPGGSLNSGERLRKALEEQTAMKVILSGLGCAPGFEAAMGLALRRTGQETSTACFDLRPAEYVEREQRRHTFSAIRLTSVFLALMFVLSCGGYIALALREFHELSSKIMKRQEEVTELEARQTALTADISRLKEREEKIAGTLKAMGQELPALEVMDTLERLCGTEIRFTTVRFAHSSGEEEKEACAVIVEGESSAPISELTEKMSNEAFFSGVEMLNSAQTGDGTTTFSLLLTTNLQGPAIDE